MIACRNLSKTYGNFTALDNLSLDIGKGETFGFIGPNGAGKSTTMRILSTLLEPTSGEARIDGVSVAEHPDDIRRIVGYMPDQFGVYDGLKVWEYLDLFAGAFRIPSLDRPKIIDGVIELTDLGPKRDTFVEALSQGLRQRLCLAKTLLHNPEVLILDEPASGLDPRARIEIREILKELTRIGKTIMISSHILPELADFCSHIGVIEAGKLIATSPVKTLIEAQGERTITLWILRKPEKALEWLQDRSEISCLDLIQGTPHKLKFHFKGGLEELAQFTTLLVQQDFGLVGLEEAKTDLEGLFLSLTKGGIH